MKTFNYSYDYDPPAPVAQITLLSATEGLQVGPLQAFVDCGADGTIVPQEYLEEIQALVTRERFLRSQWGERRRVLLYSVDLKIGDILLYACEVVGDNRSDELILGRDVLNQLRVLLDGLGEVVEIWR